MSKITAFTWADDEPSSTHGEGISRPARDARTREYCVLVFQKGSEPMTWTTRAESKRHAIRYALNRWPNAVAEVV